MISFSTSLLRPEFPAQKIPRGIFFTQVLRPGVSLVLDSGLGLSYLQCRDSLGFLKPRTSQMLQDFGAKWCSSLGFWISGKHAFLSVSRLLEYFFFQMRLTEAFSSSRHCGNAQKKDRNWQESEAWSNSILDTPKNYLTSPKWMIIIWNAWLNHTKKLWSFFDTLLLSVHFGS